MSPVGTPLQGRTPLNELLKSAKPSSHRTTCLFRQDNHAECGAWQGLSPLLGFNVCSPQNRFALFGFYRHQEDTLLKMRGWVGSAHLIRITALERSTIFWQPRILELGLFGAMLGLAWFLLRPLLFPKGFALWTPTMGLLAPLTPRQSSRALQPHLLTRAFTLLC